MPEPEFVWSRSRSRKFLKWAAPATLDASITYCCTVDNKKHMKQSNRSTITLLVYRLDKHEIGVGNLWILKNEIPVFSYTK